MIPIISAIMARRIKREKSEQLRNDEEMRQASGEAGAETKREKREENSSSAGEA